MYISKLFIKNFKSLQEVRLRFREGKNVIVGKNNAGKSNVIGALDVLFNERSPVYKNFDENDFFTKQLVDTQTGEVTELIAQYFFISATIEGRDFDEEGILSIKKATALSKLQSPNCIIDNGEVDYEMLTSLDEIGLSDKVVRVSYETISKAGNPYTRKNETERWFNAQELLIFLKSANSLKVFFCKSASTGDCGFGLLVVDSENHLWITHFLNNKLRDSLITTAIVPAFRNPKDQLRLTYYSWYGKLIKRLWDNGKEDAEEAILEKTNDIKNLADKVFGKSTLELRELLKKAIAHDNVSFKLVNNKGHELYKTVSIHVDDGIDRPIECKGSGIQSAIIISLFTSYCAEFHNSSSLLIAEEPELFLHPQARRVMSNELEKFLECNNYQRRQLIISTHSTEFIRNTNLDSIAILRKDKEQNHTKAYQFEMGDLVQDDINKIIRFIWSKNAEVFFADKALLVEGGEEYLIPAIADVSRGEKQFFDYKNISVARVDGKGNFITYIKILDKLGIPWAMLGDFDCYNDELRKIIEYKAPELQTELDAIKQKMFATPNYQKMARAIKDAGSLDGKMLQTIFLKVKDGDISIENEEVRQFIEYLEVRYSAVDTKFIIKEDAAISEQFDRLQSALYKKGIFILANGAIEDYFTEDAKAIEAKGKDNLALMIAYELDAKEKLNTLFKDVHELIAPINYLVPMEASRPEGITIPVIAELIEIFETA